MIKEQLTLTVSNNQLELTTSRVLIDADGSFTYYRWGDLDYLKPFKQTVEGRNLDLTNVKTIYFAPKCSIPRDKAKPFLEEKKIKTVRDRDTADIIIAGLDSIDAGLDTQHLYYIKTSDVKPFADGFKTGGNVHNLVERLATYTGRYVILDRAAVTSFYVSNYINPTKNMYGSVLHGRSFQSGDYYGDYITTVTNNSCSWEVYYLELGNRPDDWLVVLAYELQRPQSMVLLWKNMFPYIPPTRPTPVVLPKLKTLIFPTESLTVTPSNQIIHGAI